jgi:hypothetical protein
MRALGSKGEETSRLYRWKLGSMRQRTIALDTLARCCLESLIAWQARARTEVSQLGHAGGSWERSARRRRTIPYPTVGPHDGKHGHQCGDGRLSYRVYASNCWLW